MFIATSPIELARSVVYHRTVLAKSRSDQRSTLLHPADNTQIQLTRAAPTDLRRTVRSQYTIFDKPSSALEHLLYTLQQLGYSKSSRFVHRLSSSHSDFVLTVTASSILCLPSWTLLTGQEPLSIRQICHLYKEFRSVTTSQQTSCALRMRKGSSRGTVPLRMMASTRDMLDFRKTSISNTQHSTTTISLDPILTQSTVLRMKVHVDLHQFDRRVKMLNVRHELDSKTLCLA